MTPADLRIIEQCQPDAQVLSSGAIVAVVDGRHRKDRRFRVAAVWDVAVAGAPQLLGEYFGPDRRECAAQLASRYVLSGDFA